MIHLKGIEAECSEKHASSHIKLDLEDVLLTMRLRSLVFIHTEVGNTMQEISC